MNKDLDERLVPNGEYRDALNLDIANSEGSNVGALQNVKGNVELRNQTANDLWQAKYIEDLSNPICIGSIRDDKTERVYWFIASDSVSAIAELDQTSGIISPVLVDTNNILKFSKDYLITGINILDEFLFFTDDQTEPKKINIRKFKTGSCDFQTHTKIPDWNPDATSEDQRYVQFDCSNIPAGLLDFTESDITVIKKSPLTAPGINATVSRFGNDVIGTGITPVTLEYNQAGSSTTLKNFTYVPDVSNQPGIIESLPTHSEYLAEIQEDPDHYDGSNLPTNYGNGITLDLNNSVQDVWSAGDIVVINTLGTDEFNNSYQYGIRALVISVANDQCVVKILAISEDIRVFEDLLLWEAVVEEEEPMYEYVMPRFAYRWKYIDNEYSAFSPFSEVAFLGDEFKYLSSDGYNIGMTNNIRKLILTGLTSGSDEVAEIEILYKESNNTSIYCIDSIKKKDFSPHNVPAGAFPTTFEIKSEIIGKTIQGNQLLRPFDNVPRKAKAQEIIANRVVYGNYLQNYTVDKTIQLDINYLSAAHQGYLPQTSADQIDKIGFPEKSLKSIRTYQGGVVFKDEFGRETPVITNNNASINLPVDRACDVNSLAVTPSGAAPSWATHYKFFIKNTANEFYNLALDRYYFAEDGNVWLSFPSSERNKVDEETYLILKKQHDNFEPVKDLVRYKIIAIESEAPDFISTFRRSFAQDGVTAQTGFEPGFTRMVFNISTNATDEFKGGFRAGNYIQITDGANATNTYLISGGGATGQNNIEYSVRIDEPLGTDAAFLPSFVAAGGSPTMRLLQETVERKPEFEGRFFVKINRDFNFDENIVASFSNYEEVYASTGRIDIANKIINSRTKPPQPWCWFDNGTAECQPEGRKLGSSLGGNGPLGTRRFEFDPPIRTKDYFGVLWPMRTSSDRFPNVDGVMAVVGALIRFRGRTEEEVSEPYRVIAFEKKNGRRGMRDYSQGDLNSCDWSDQREIPSNKRVEFWFKLDRPIEESWLDIQYWNNFDTGFENGIQDSPCTAVESIEKVISDDNKLLTSINPAIFETEPKEAVDLDLYYEASDALPIASFGNQQVLEYYNCFSYGTGVETNRVRDDFNAPTIDKGPKVSAPLDEPYAEERRGSGMIFSQIYNSISGINGLNQFIQAEAITKDLNPIYGSIQKLHARDTDAIILCEDKCLRVLADKDALFNADGSANVTSNRAVLGQAVPYAGEFGISKNPESFASYAFRAYFSDKNRGAVIRLSADGITNIAEKGMTDFFNDNLAASKNIIGSYDDNKDIYNLTLDKLSQQWVNAFSPSQDYQLSPECNVNTSGPINETTISFKENVDGWTSRKSFIPESGISLNNKYYTFKDGRIYEHELNSTTNNFYRIQHDSSFNVIINDLPNVVKGYSTLNYSGTRSRRFEYQYGQKFYSIAEINELNVIPTFIREKRPGWYVNFVKTNLEGGEVKEFEKKEGKYFNFIKTLEIFNDCEEIPDGIGNPDLIDSDPQNYNLTFTIDPSCSASGSVAQFFFYQWGLTKQDPSLIRSILNETTAQNAKCVIEEFYSQNSVNSNYSNVVNLGSSFSYSASSGLSVGTQMYLEGTTTAASAGTYLFTTTGQTQGAVSISHEGLDADNPFPVPSSYYIMILDSDGKIASYTQYNTLTSCTNTGPPNGSKALFSRYNSRELPIPTPPVDVITPYLVFSTDTNNEIICKHKTALTEFNASSLPYPAPSTGASYKTLTLSGTTWRWYDSSQGGTDTIQLGTIIRDSNGDPMTFAQVGIYSSSAPVFPTIQSWADITVWPSYWYIVKTNTSGEVTTFQQINQLSNPTCS